MVIHITREKSRVFTKSENRADQRKKNGQSKLGGVSRRQRLTTKRKSFFFQKPRCLYISFKKTKAKKFKRFYFRVPTPISLNSFFFFVECEKKEMEWRNVNKWCTVHSIYITLPKLHGIYIHSSSNISKLCVPILSRIADVLYQVALLLCICS